MEDDDSGLGECFTESQALEGPTELAASADRRSLYSIAPEDHGIVAFKRAK